MTTTGIEALTEMAVAACEGGGLIVTAIPNAFGGTDICDEDGNVARLAQDEPDGGVELFVLSPNRILRTEARFGQGFPASVIASAVYASLDG